MDTENKAQQDATASDTKRIVMWRDADDPPEGNKDFWTRKVVAVTNLGNVYSLSYYHGKDGGVWQRLMDFEEPEKVDKWTEFPGT